MPREHDDQHFIRVESLQEIMCIISDIVIFHFFLSSLYINEYAFLVERNEVVEIRRVLIV